jgi:hypothetical protein
MRPREALSDGMVDLYIGRVLKHWARNVPPPSDGKSRLLDSLSNSNRLQPLSYRSVAVAVQELLVELLSPSSAPTAQPIIYSDDVSRVDRPYYHAEFEDLSAQLLDELSMAMGANYFAVIA